MRMLLERFSLMSFCPLCSKSKGASLQAGQKIQQCMISSKVIGFFIVEMSTGELGKEFDQDLTFKMNVSQFRRKQLMESMMSDSK